MPNMNGKGENDADEQLLPLVELPHHKNRLLFPGMFGKFIS